MTWHVYLKELKDSLRDRKTILLSVMLPILFNIAIIFFMDNFMMNDSVDQVNVAISKSTEAQVIEWIEDIEGIEISTTSDPVKMVEDGEALVSVSVEEDFINKIENHQSPQIIIQADPTSSKASAASDKLINILTVKQQEYVQTHLTEQNIDPSVLVPFGVSLESISGDDDMSLYMVSIFAQMIIVFAVLMGGLPAANDLFAGEKERKTMEALLMTPVKRIHIVIGKWLTISTLSMMSGIFSVITFVLYVTLFTDNMADALKLEDHIGFFTISLGVGIIFFALLVASIQMIVSLIADTIKEAGNYISPITFIAMIPYFILIGISANELSTVHFLIPFFNIYALIKQLIYGIYDISSILLVTGSSLVFIICSFLIALVMFMKSKWVLGKS
ncbi:ABC transporter permease [Ferdinandcohnia quinoae]|uniref:ABC transporter permease n=1 Tax=Fredinandcohnia quinoae TaxID=2918902 RepID=A0AAW5E2Z1_9BACI|nr:ABC transporter permease [Fredinandcohnia sp. SECRCQ15]MCH1627271.1 ABC transporter permease [Fredinandcohnia sp. SECRCQ15]